jgi:hypothetical protein
MSTRNFPGDKARMAHKADNITAICEPIVLEISQPYVRPQPIRGVVLFLYF